MKNIMKKPFIWILWGIIIGLCTPLLVLSETVKIQAVAEPAPLKLHNLSNEELLNQAQTIFNEASNKFRAELRGVLGNEKLLEKNKKETEDVVILAEKPTLPADEMSSFEIVKVTLDHEKNRLDALQQKLTLTEAEKTLIEKQLIQIEAAQSAADIFVDRLGDLDVFVLEIELRLSDGTLADSEKLGFLTTSEMENQKQALLIQQDTLKDKMKEMQEALDKIILRLETLKTSIFKMETDYSSTKEKYFQELKRQEIEQEYLKQKPNTLLTKMIQLQEERVWLNGTFNLSYRQFRTHNTNMDKLEKELEALAPPDIIKLQMIPAEETQQATKIAQEILDYYVDRIMKLRKLHTNLTLLIKYTASLEEDATILSQHIFKMLVLAKILESFVNQEQMTMDSIPNQSRSEALTIVSDTLSERLSNVRATAKETKERLTQIDEDIKKSQLIQNEVSEKLANLKKVYEFAQQNQQWELELKGLTPKQIVYNFQENAKKISTNQQVLQKLREQLKQAQAVVEEEKLSLKSLKDPLLRSAEQESLEKKHDILKTLYKFAELDLPPDEMPGAVETASVDDEIAQNVDNSSSEKEVQLQSDTKPAPMEEIEAYQNLLSNRTRIIEKQQEHRAKLLKKLNSLNQQIKQYVDMLSETKKIASQHYANAVELKKRLGRGQLDDDDIPDGITEALKSDVMTQLSNEITDMMNYQITIQQQIASLSQQDNTLKEIQIVLTEAQILVGKRIDVLLELQKLEQDFERKPDTRSKTELKKLEQTATRRLESEHDITEFLLSFIPSDRADSLTELMQIYYLELSELENKQANLQMQKEKIERLTQLAENEKGILFQLLPLLQKQKAQLDERKGEEWVKIQAQFMPQQILSHFETKAEHDLSMPATILEQQKIKLIEEATERVFDWVIQIVSVEKWTALFEQRLDSSAGIDVEIGNYQDKLGILNAKDSAIQRRIQQISGHSRLDLAKLEADKKSQIKINKLKFLEGELGVLRAESYQIRTQEALKVLIKLIAIFLVAIVINWLTNRVVEWTLDNSKKAAKKQSYSLIKNKPVEAFIILSPLLKTLFVFIVWVTAIIFGLSTLGFEAGTVLAGLGIGGLAVAMASQKTLSDIIGGVSILLARSFKVGDIILHNGEPVTIEDISLRYTRLRQYTTDYLHTIPNSLLSEQQLTNISSAYPGVYRTMELPLSINNTASQLELAMSLIVDVIAKNPEASFRWMRFDSFEDYTFRIKTNFGVKWPKKDRLQTEIYLEVVRQLQQNNIEFAHPV